ncbi:hypothetical protein CH063_00341 [Colletotrichum higginsianum]|uniref:Uncharacterized protein n=1 Tax=Colletotrichum higginsianum (strain IMI 349063) TaxID=759273 RepID=H1VIU1_COLHI|nr:hypothetical protein CH063_00341 [Colletotrichum higginsianum]
MHDFEESADDSCAELGPGWVQPVFLRHRRGPKIETSNRARVRRRVQGTVASMYSSSPIRRKITLSTSSMPICLKRRHQMPSKRQPLHEHRTSYRGCASGGVVVAPANQNNHHGISGSAVFGKCPRSAFRGSGMQAIRIETEHVLRHPSRQSHPERPHPPSFHLMSVFFPAWIGAPTPSPFGLRSITHASLGPAFIRCVLPSYSGDVALASLGCCINNVRHPKQ